jgi:thiol-disulfide isomerase/thioredoxin
VKTKLNKCITHGGGEFIALLLLMLFTSQVYAGGWSIKDTEGVKYKLADLKGKWVVVNFWAPWCPPCLAEIPELNTLQQQHKDVLVIGVSEQYKRKQEVTDVVKKLSVTYPVVFGDEDTAAEFGGIEGLPTTFIYSPEGKLVMRHDGPVTQQEIELSMAQK